VSSPLGDGAINPADSYYHALRSANAVRNVYWTKGAGVDFTWRATELAGEVGELCGAVFSDVAHVGLIADELADVVICVDLTAMSAGLPSFEARRSSTPFYRQERVALLGIETGLACNVLKKLEREKRGWVGSRAKLPDLDFRLGRIIVHCADIAAHYDIDLDAAVRNKFNETSTKVGLPVFLR
jgi:hypothetical protein